MTNRSIIDEFRDEQPEPRVRRMWRAIDGRRAARVAPTRRRLGVLGVALAAACALAFVGFAALRAGGPGALTLAHGRPLPSRFVSGSSSTLAEFSDASTLRLAPRTLVDVIESSDRSIGFALREGFVRVSVTPHGPRRWRIDCGNVQVEVVGTVFTVQRSSRSVVVAVARGAVVVRGEGVPDRVVRLVAGERVEVRPPDPTVAAVSAAPPTPAPTAETARGGQQAPTSGADREPVPRTLDAFDRAIARHDFDAAYDSVGPEGLASRADRSRSVDELFELADVARLSGHPADARAPLTRVVEHFPGDSRAAIAAFTLGQIELGAMRDPGAAARRFEQSLDLGLPRSARETASARLVESLSRARSPDTRGAADAYLATYPEGRYRADVERWRGP